MASEKNELVVVERAELLPPILSGGETPAVRKRVEKFFSSVADIFERWVTRRTSPHTQRAYREDIRIRLYGGEPSNKTGYVVRAHEIQPGVIYRDDKITVKAFRVRHGSWGEAYGYRFETADRTIVVSGDTGPDEAIIKNCNGCDVLIHEVYSDAGFRKRPPEWQDR
mgnify:CR=1 FL=1